MGDYERIDINSISNSRIYSWWRIAALVLVYVATTTLVYLTWNSVIDDSPLYPKYLGSAVPDQWYQRAVLYSNNPAEISHDIRLLRSNQTARMQKDEAVTAAAAAATAVTAVSALPMPSRAKTNSATAAATAAAAIDQRLVCYYSLPSSESRYDDLRLRDVHAHLCTHINIGMAEVMANASIEITDRLRLVLQNDVAVLRAQNPTLKLLLWVGGGGASSRGFSNMVKNHSTRKLFIQSLKRALRLYRLDGVDLDWEFPSAYNKERQHLSQLLYEIKQEYRREKRDYLLTVAAAAPEGIAMFAYDVRELNLYADFVNVMTYDYHFYTTGTPFTGLNAPLYARHSEHSIWATLNVNYSVNWWLRNGLERKKLVVGLPSYGHTFTLVNPFNNRILAPAENMGRCGTQGFASFSEICWFKYHNLVTLYYDEESCSPYLSSGKEWISYENVKSIACKTRYVKSNSLGGVMIFSLNTDDFRSVCIDAKASDAAVTTAARATVNTTFPLVSTVNRILFSKQ